MAKYSSMETAPKDGTRILVWNIETYASWNEQAVPSLDETGEWMLVSWLHNREGGQFSRFEWAVPESWQDEQGGYVTADHPVCWTPLPDVPDGY